MAGIDDSTSIEEGNELADQVIEKAISIDPNHAFSYFVRGSSRIHNKFKFKDGAEDLEHALSLDPGNSFFIGATGTGARVTGKFDVAAEHYLKSISLDPVVPEFHTWLGLVSLSTGHFDEALKSYRKMLAISPEFAGGHYRISRVYLEKGNLPEALAEMKKEPHSIYEPTGLAMVYHAMGNEVESQRALTQLIEAGADGAAFQIAEVYSTRGEPDEAFEWLEESYKIRDSGLASILGNPAFSDLRSDSRWPAFLEKIGLLEYWLEMPPEWGGPLK